MRKMSLFGMAAAVLLLAQPAQAWDRVLVGTAEVARGGLTAQAATEWNSGGGRPSQNGESWTKDGFLLNKIDFLTQIAPGETLFRDRQREERPLPTYNDTMLLPEVAELFESSFRLVNGVSQLEVTALEPGTLAGQAGITMQYTYALANEALVRRGEARMAVINGKLYVVNFTAPELHYFGALIGEVRGIFDSVQLGSGTRSRR